MKPRELNKKYIGWLREYYQAEKVAAILLFNDLLEEFGIKSLSSSDAAAVILENGVKKRLEKWIKKGKLIEDGDPKKPNRYISHNNHNLNIYKGTTKQTFADQIRKVKTWIEEDKNSDLINTSIIGKRKKGFDKTITLNPSAYILGYENNGWEEFLDELENNKDTSEVDYYLPDIIIKKKIPDQLISELRDSLEYIIGDFKPNKIPDKNLTVLIVPFIGLEKESEIKSQKTIIQRLLNYKNFEKHPVDINEAQISVDNFDIDFLRGTGKENKSDIVLTAIDFPSKESNGGEIDLMYVVVDNNLSLPSHEIHTGVQSYTLSSLYKGHLQTDLDYFIFWLLGFRAYQAGEFETSLEYYSKINYPDNDVNLRKGVCYHLKNDSNLAEAYKCYSKVIENYKQVTKDELYYKALFNSIHILSFSNNNLTIENAGSIKEEYLNIFCNTELDLSPQLHYQITYSLMESSKDKSYIDYHATKALEAEETKEPMQRLLGYYKKDQNPDLS